MTTLYVIRHGLRLDHEDKSWGKTAARRFDPPLAEKGHVQAQSTARYLKDKGVTALYVSPLLRTIQTATPIAEGCGLDMKIEPGLAEWLNPKWYDFSAGFLDLEGMKKSVRSIDLEYRPLVTPRYPETEEAICVDRVAFTARQLFAETAKAEAGNVALISHGICVKSIVDQLTDGKGTANTQTCAINVMERGLAGAWKLTKTVTDHLTVQEDTVEFI